MKDNVTVQLTYCVSKNNVEVEKFLCFEMCSKAYENIKADFEVCDMSSQVQCRSGKQLNSMLEKLCILQGYKKLEWWQIYDAYSLEEDCGS